MVGFPVLFATCWSCTVVCCQVIDEIYRVLRYVNSTRAPQRAHEVLQELRDISSMAMEYFDEKIVPILKKKLPGADLSGRLIGSAPGNGHVCPWLKVVLLLSIRKQQYVIKVAALAV